ncbi:Bax inhibitor-1 family protein [Prunus dulcis]|uniref:Bax inhibitor-1 family protein n=1 Tax=Prunus dulcis TaxID=3755 RepID=A0A4Y1QKI4_PRUDU|nr:Bax inhibitor-1 family protein [Prunus dulcis]
MNWCDLAMALKFMKGRDLEAGRGQNGEQQLYPNQMETPQLRWAFIRKVYMIVAFQLLLTVGISYAVVSIPAIPNSYDCLVLLPQEASGELCASYSVYDFTFDYGKSILLAVILTATVVVGLTIYTFWAVKRGQDFSFLGPFLFAATLMLMVFGLIQIFFPLGPFSRMVYSALGALLCCAYIVYDTDNLIKRLSYDEYIFGALSIYIDVVQLFLFLLSLISGGR